MKRLDHLTLEVWLGLSMAVVGRSAGCPSLRKPEVLDPSLALTLKSKKEAQRLLSSGSKAYGEFSAHRGQCRERGATGPWVGWWVPLGDQDPGRDKVQRRLHRQVGVQVSMSSPK